MAEPLSSLGRPATPALWQSGLFPALQAAQAVTAGPTIPADHYEPAHGRTATNDEPVGGAPRTATRILRQGAEGDTVRTLQQRLRTAGFDPGTPDGDFGPLTYNALLSFQRARGLVADGVAGPKTWAALGVSRAPSQQKAPSVSGAHVNTAHGPMVRRQGQLLSPRIAPQFDAMAAAAARSGVSLRIEEGYRSYAEQVVLWNRYGHDRSRVAPPGQSNHQTGTAIDFQETPGAYRWLRHHASRFGLINYAPEPWHYSLSGD